MAKQVKLLTHGQTGQTADTWPNRSNCYVVGEDDDIEELKDEVMKDLGGILKKVDPHLLSLDYCRERRVE